MDTLGQLKKALGELYMAIEAERPMASGVVDRILNEWPDQLQMSSVLCVTCNGMRRDAAGHRCTGCGGAGRHASVARW